MLDKEEIKRYAHHLQLPEIGIEGQQKLKQAKVLVVGAGGLGCAVLQYLNAAGIGTIGVMDFDFVQLSNLQRQVLYNESDIGKSKVNCALEKLKQQNSITNLIAHNEKLKEINSQEIFSNYDLIVDCTDNYETRYIVNDACIKTNKAFVYGAIYKFEGQIAIFNQLNDGNRSANYRDLFPENKEPQTFTSCSDVGVIGVLPGIVGLLQANEVIKVITGIGDTLINKLLLINLLSMQFEIMHYNKK